MIVFHRFEWDLREAARNVAMHGVSFKEATTVFADEGCAISADGDGRLVALGRSARGRRLLVAHQPGERIRILSAKPLATKAAKGKAPEATAKVAEASEASEAAKGKEPKAEKGKAARVGKAPKKAAGPAKAAAKVEKGAPRRGEPRPGSWRAAARALAIPPPQEG